MQHVDPQDPRIANARPGWALVILSLPILMVIFVALAYAGMLALGLTGRQATGPEVTFAFTGCPAARPHVEGRLADMGLPARFTDAPDGFRAAVVLPADPRAAAGIGETLARVGDFAVRAGDEVLVTNADVTSASVRLDVMMTPSTLVELGPDAAIRVRDWVRAHPDGQLDFLLDGEVIGAQPARAPVAIGELEIAPPIPDEHARMLATASWSVVIDHGPLPCAVSVAEAPAGPAPGGASSR